MLSHTLFPGTGEWGEVVELLVPLGPERTGGQGSWGGCEVTSTSSCEPVARFVFSLHRRRGLEVPPDSSPASSCEEGLPAGCTFPCGLLGLLCDSPLCPSPASRTGAPRMQAG